MRTVASGAIVLQTPSSLSPTIPHCIHALHTWGSERPALHAHAPRPPSAPTLAHACPAVAEGRPTRPALPAVLRLQRCRSRECERTVHACVCMLCTRKRVTRSFARPIYTQGFPPPFPLPEFSMIQMKPYSSRPGRPLGWCISGSILLSAHLLISGLAPAYYIIPAASCLGTK